MKIQVYSIEALITWFVKTLAALKAASENRPDGNGELDNLGADPFEIIARLPDYDAHMATVQGELLRPVTLFIPRMETVLDDLMADNKTYETGLHNRQNKNRQRDKALRSLLMVGRYYYEGMKCRQQESGTEEGALIMQRVKVPPASATSADEITSRMRELIEHEKALQNKGYQPLTAPTFELLQKRYDQALEALAQSQKAALDLLQAQQQRRQSGEKGRRLVRKLYKFLEFFYSELPGEQRRTIGRVLGYIFTNPKEKAPPTKQPEEPQSPLGAPAPKQASEPTSPQKQSTPGEGKGGSQPLSGSKMDEAQTKDLAVKKAEELPADGWFARTEPTSGKEINTKSPTPGMVEIRWRKDSLPDMFSTSTPRSNSSEIVDDVLKIRTCCPS